MNTNLEPAAWAAYLEALGAVVADGARNPRLVAEWRARSETWRRHWAAAVRRLPVAGSGETQFSVNITKQP